MVGRPRRINPTGGGNEPWQRQGPDCATLLRGFEEGTFSDWAEFTAVPDYHIFDRKYIRENLRRNFETTKERWDSYHRDGSGDITANLRQLAGLPPPRLTGGGVVGGQPAAQFVPGNDGGDEDEEDLLDELQEDQEQPPPPANPPAPVQPPPTRRELNLDVETVLSQLRNLGVDDDDDTMKGCFIQEVTDPDDTQRTTNRVGVYCVLYGGVHVDLIEVTRVGDSVKFAGTMDSRVGNAQNLLGFNLAADPGTVRALQASIDKQLQDHQSQGGSNDGSLPAEARVKLPPSPNGLGWRAGFVSPHTNGPVGDPLFFNRIPSNDPEMQSDTMGFFAFLIENKAQEHGAPARGRRDHRNQLARGRAPTPAPAPAPALVPRRHRQRNTAMDIDVSSTQRIHRSTGTSRPRNTRTASPRRRQRIDECQSYIEESDEAFENIDNFDVSGSFESANEYADPYDDDEHGNVTTVVSEE